MDWIRQLICKHSWRKPMFLVALNTGKALVGAKFYCTKCNKLGNRGVKGG